LGRSAALSLTLRLDVHAAKIDEYLGKGIDKCALEKHLDVLPNTV
jgi:hypothetical protein